MNSKVNRSSDESILKIVVYLTGERLFVNANEKKMLLALSSQYIRPNLCHGL